MAKAKIGAGHLAAMGRLGLKELGQALQALPTSNIRVGEEPGTIGNPTPQEVTKGRGGYNQMLQGYANRGTPAQGPSRGQER